MAINQLITNADGRKNIISLKGLVLGRFLLSFYQNGFEILSRGLYFCSEMEMSKWLENSKIE